jgi:elongation factor Ts
MKNIELIKKLRDETGCGLVRAKQLLEKAEGDYQDALALAKLEMLMRPEDPSRTTENGRIEQYVHTGSLLAVLVEINCETDFAANTDEFKEFCQKIAMQIAAMNPQWLTVEDVEEWALRDIIVKFHRWAFDLAGDLSDEDRKNRASDRLDRWYSEVCLLEQRSIHDHTVGVEEMRAEISAKLRENIVIRRWVRWELGE